MTVDHRTAALDLDGLDETDARRVRLTVSCRDCDRLPKVEHAGEVQLRDGQAIQIMHNGLVIEEGCYCGSWMTQVIRGLDGHHEPQEELIFDAIVSRIGASNVDHPTIIELGSWWSYYSLWFCRALPGAHAIAMEPDPAYLEVGRRNAELNGMTDRITFLSGAIGPRPGESMTFRTESTREDVSVVQHDLASLMDEYGVAALDLALVDIQGVETLLLERARPLLSAGKVKFILVSTHHQSISGDPLTHQNALGLLRDCGAHIIAEHTVRESFSGDGLIAATFDASQRDLVVPISYARPSVSLYGAPEYELAALDREVAVRDRGLAASRAEVARMQRSKLWRWSTMPRALYGRLRRSGRRR